jgi:hypothetical protein
MKTFLYRNKCQLFIIIVNLTGSFDESVHIYPSFFLSTLDNLKKLIIRLRGV